VLCFLPGVSSLGFSFPLERRRTWAAITLLVINALHIALLFLAFIRALLGSLWLDAAVLLLLFGSGALAIIFIAMAMPTLRTGGKPRPTGFEPIMSSPPQGRRGL